MTSKMPNTQGPVKGIPLEDKPEGIPGIGCLMQLLPRIFLRTSGMSYLQMVRSLVRPLIWTFINRMLPKGQILGLRPKPRIYRRFNAELLTESLILF